MSDVIVEFGPSQSLDALREAAYRLLPDASCHVDTVGERRVCRLTPKRPDGGEDLRVRFLDLVTDENLREKVAEQTSGIRDVIVALAFGALARERDQSASE